MSAPHSPASRSSPFPKPACRIIHPISSTIASACRFSASGSTSHAAGRSRAPVARPPGQGRPTAVGRDLGNVRDPGDCIGGHGDRRGHNGPVFVQSRDRGRLRSQRSGPRFGVFQAVAALRRPSVAAAIYFNQPLSRPEQRGPLSSGNLQSSNNSRLWERPQ